MKELFNQLDKIDKQLEALKSMLEHSNEHNELTLQTRSKKKVKEKS